MLENKAFQLIFTFWKQLEYQILGFTVSIATLCMQKNSNAIFYEPFYRRYILKISKKLNGL